LSRFKQWVLESAAPLPSSWGTGAMGKACTGRAAPIRIRRGSHLRPCSLRQVYTSWSMDGFGDSTREPGIHSLWRQSPCDRMVMLTCNPLGGSRLPRFGGSHCPKMNDAWGQRQYSSPEGAVEPRHVATSTQARTSRQWGHEFPHIRVSEFPDWCDRGRTSALALV